MRITTGMMNLAHRRAGLSERGNSLLTYIGKKGQNGSRLNALNATNTRAARMERGSYEKLEKSADGLTDAVSGMAAGIDSGKEDVSSEVASMVERFNETLKNLKNSSGVLNQFYLQSMREISGTNQNELEEIGITVSADGSLSLNRERLAGANKEKVGKLLGSNGDFVQRVSHVSSRVADNAEVNAQSISSRYNSKGSIANSYLNKYNFWG